MNDDVMGRISKKQREEIKQKFGGLCAYSGTPLEDDWQVDHVKPLVRNRFDGTSMFPDAHCCENLVPCQKIINHYKGSLDLETFRTWFLGGLHQRIDTPKNPRTEKSKRKKEYLNKVASYFGITRTKPFNGVFYFENDLAMIEPLKEDYTREEIEKYLNDWDNLEDTGWFNNPSQDIADYTFHHKSFDDLRQFLSKGREIIRQRLMEKKRT